MEGSLENLTFQESFTLAVNALVQCAKRAEADLAGNPALPDIMSMLEEAQQAYGGIQEKIQEGQQDQTMDQPGQPSTPQPAPERPQPTS